MELTTSQVATKLGVTKSTIVKLVKDGKLKDLAAHKNGQHHFRIDSKEVNEFAKSYNPSRKGRLTANTKVANDSPNKLNGIFSRLDRIESKLEVLINMWK